MFQTKILKLNQNYSEIQALVGSLETNNSQAVVVLVEKSDFQNRSKMTKAGISEFLSFLIPNDRQLSPDYCLTKSRYIISLPNYDLDLNKLTKLEYDELIKQNLFEIEMSLAKHEIFDCELLDGIEFDRLATKDQSAHQDILVKQNGLQVPIVVGIIYIECGSDKLCFYDQNTKEAIGSIETERLNEDGFYPIVFFNGSAFHGRNDLEVSTNAKRHILIKAVYEF
jgi:hypothetical protein